MFVHYLLYKTLPHKSLVDSTNAETVEGNVGMPESAPPPETSHVLWIIKIQGQDNQKKPLATLSLGVNWLFSQ